MRAVFIFLWIAGALISIGCTEARNEQISKSEGLYNSFIDPNDPFAIPDALFTHHSSEEDGNILHPAGFLASLEVLPKTECDKEKLRRLVIAMNMYSYDMMNQSYYLDTNTSGAKVLEKTFPEVIGFYGERGTAVSINKVSDYLRGVKFNCEI